MDQAKEVYKVCLSCALRFRYTFVILILAFTGFSLKFSQKNMKFILFPAEGVEQFVIRAKAPAGSSLEDTLTALQPLEKKVVDRIGAHELDDYLVTIGLQQNDPNDPFKQRGKNLAEIRLYLTPESNRSRVTSEIINDMRDQMSAFAETSLIDIEIEALQTGPPVGKPVSIQIKSQDLKEGLDAASEVEMLLSKNSNIIDVSRDYTLDKNEYLIELNKQKLAQSGTTSQDVALSIRTALDGTIAGFIYENGKKRNIRVGLNKESRSQIDQIKKINVINQFGQRLPIDAVADFKQQMGPSSIKHIDTDRTITITANLKDKKQYSSQDANNDIEPSLLDISKKFPNMVINQGGEFEDTNESMESLKIAFFFAMASIFLILSTLFGNILQPLVVMMAIPFGIVGVIWSLYFHNMPLSFIAMIGTIGLSGVVVNDSIVLVDFTNKLYNSGLNKFNAVLYGGCRRFRPVWLTTLTTVFGLVPIVYGIGGEDKFLQPAAVALGYGLLFGTVLILLLIPAFSLIREDLVCFVFGKHEKRNTADKPLDVDLG